MSMAKPNCLTLFMHSACCPFCLALESAGSSIAARIAMMAMTTSSSINVNARRPASGRVARGHNSES